MKKGLLFDFDGTLVDSGEGVLLCIEKTLRHYGLPMPEARGEFIGPPLAMSFPKLGGLPEEKVEEAIALYRRYYLEDGLFRYRVYDGVPEMLARLKEAGYRIATATTKPLDFAIAILRDAGMEGYFDVLKGATMTERDKKAQIIRYALDALALSPDDAYMIGDRHYDMDGAKINGVEGIGILWGYGGEEELLSSGAVAVYETPRDLALALAP